MSTPHKHAVELRAIAEGDAVESRRIGSFAWYALNNLSVLDDDDYEFRLKPHRWQECIDAQKAGKAIQVRKFKDNIWHGFAKDQEINFDATDDEFRIKPEMIRFRMYLLGGAITTAEVLHSEHFAAKAEADASFIRWLGDWQEVEA